MADIQAGKWTFCPNLLNIGSDFLNYIIVNLMLHEIHQQSYILPDMSQLNPKYFWIWLTSLENTLILKWTYLAFYSISEQMGSHISLFLTFNVEKISLYKKNIKKFALRWRKPGTFRSEDQCVDHWATLPLHIIWQKHFWIYFSV